MSTIFSDLFFLIPVKEEGKKMLPDILQTDSNQSMAVGCWAFVVFFVLFFSFLGFTYLETSSAE